MSKSLAVICFCFLFSWKTKAEGVTADSLYPVLAGDSSQAFLELKNTEELHSPSTIFQRIREKIEDNKKVIAAALAFPLPVGVVGAHRIYLGSKPYIPLVYIATVGGCFGILPLIDFVVILLTKKEDLGQFENNSRIFMWVK